MEDRQNKHGRMTEAAFLRTLMVSVLGILLCLTGLAGATWAWFTAEVTSGSNTLQFADYSVQMQIDWKIDTAYTERITDTEGQGAGQTLTAGEYTITLTLHTGDAAATGYCMLTIQTAQADTGQSGTRQDDTKPDSANQNGTEPDSSNQNGTNLDLTDPDAADQHTSVYYTPVMQDGEPFVFPLTAADGVEVTLSSAPCWGTPPKEGEGNILTDTGLTVNEDGITANTGDAAGEEPPETTTESTEASPAETIEETTEQEPAGTPAETDESAPAATTAGSAGQDAMETSADAGESDPAGTPAETGESGAGETSAESGERNPANSPAESAGADPAETGQEAVAREDRQ